MSEFSACTACFPLPIWSSDQIPRTTLQYSCKPSSTRLSTLCSVPTYVAPFVQTPSFGMCSVCSPPLTRLLSLIVNLAQFVSPSVAHPAKLITINNCVRTPAYCNTKYYLFGNSIFELHRSSCLVRLYFLSNFFSQYLQENVFTSCM